MIQIIPTQAGCDLIVQCMTSGDGYQISKVEIGNGADAGGMDAEELSNPLETLEITAAVRSGSKLALTCVLSNSNTEDAFEITEYGVFATDPDNEGQYILLGYLHMDSKTTVWPAATDFGAELVLHLEVFVGPVENVSAILGSSLVYAMQEDLQDHIDNKNNPHETTWEQTGAAAADHTHTPEDVGAAPADHSHSPEDVGAAPADHSHSPEDVGAASKSHVHKAGDITSGTLSVVRGGTGKGAWAKDRLLYASATDALAQLAFGGANKVLHQAASGAPFWGYPQAVEYGSYVGNNTYGQNNKTSITFTRGIPKYLIITNRQNNAGYERGCHIAFICPSAGTGSVIVFPDYESGEFSTATNWKDWITKALFLWVFTSGNTVSWYSVHNAIGQMNGPASGGNNQRYDYIGFY